MFQAEVLAISEVAKNPVLEKMHNQRIVVLVDSQAAIKSLIKCTVTSITGFNCIRNLNQLGKQNHVSIVCTGAYLGGGPLGHGPPLWIARIAKLHSKVSKIEAWPPPL